MSLVSIIGTGTMAQAIAGVLTRGGTTVELVGRDDELDAASDIVVLAVPYGAVADVVARHGSALVGKTVVDISNPVDFSTFDSLTVPTDSSATAQVAAALPGSRVLKAFNTTMAASLATGVVTNTDGTTAVTTVLIAGDDAPAKAALASLVEAGGLRAIDAGSLRRARELEAVGFLQISLAVAEKIAFTGGFALLG